MDDTVNKEQRMETAGDGRARLKEAEELERCLYERPRDPGFAARLAAFAHDPKYNVRIAVARGMAMMPLEDGLRLSFLENDVNCLVANNAQSSLTALRKEQARQERARHRACGSAEDWEDFRNRFGVLAERKARKLTTSTLAMLTGNHIHDINGIVGRMRAQFGFLRELEFAVTPEKRNEFNRCMLYLEDNVACLERIACDVKDFVRMPDEKPTCESAVGLAEEACRGLRDELEFREGRRPEVVFEITGDRMLTVEVQRIAVLRAFRNLVKNAVESYETSTGEPGGGKVEIAVSEDGDLLRMDIRDRGRGIRPDQLAVLRRFQPNATSHKQTGTGFGLAIAHAKIADQGGTLEMESEYGVGTVMKITLPRRRK